MLTPTRIEEALERFTKAEPELPYNLHGDLTTILEAARLAVAVLAAIHEGT